MRQDERVDAAIEVVGGQVIDKFAPVQQRDDGGVRASRCQRPVIPTAPNAEPDAIARPEQGRGDDEISCGETAGVDVLAAGLIDAVPAGHEIVPTGVERPGRRAASIDEGALREDGRQHGETLGHQGVDQVARVGLGRDRQVAGDGLRAQRCGQCDHGLSAARVIGNSLRDVHHGSASPCLDAQCSLGVGDLRWRQGASGRVNGAHSPIVGTMALFGRRKKAVEDVVEEVAPAPTLPTPPAPGPDGLRSLPDHRSYVLSQIESLPPFGMKLLDAWGLALCEDLRADVDVPDQQVAATDGYAMRAADVEGSSFEVRQTLRIKDGDAIKVGATTRIAAGDPLPEGADAVLPTDRAEIADDVLTVSYPVAVGDNVLARGAHITADDVIARTGDVVDTRIVSLLAAAGIDKVMARPRPRVAVISVGGDLVDPGRRSATGQDYDINSFLLSSAAKRDGASVWRMGAASRDFDLLRELVADQLIRADLILAAATTQADREALEAVMSDLGLTDFADLSIHPGRRQGFGLIGEDEVPMLMLPGDSLATFIGYHTVARPVIRKLMGAEPYGHQAVMCYSEDTITSDRRALEFALARVEMRDGNRQAAVLGDLRTPTLVDLSQANALVVLPEDKMIVRPGDKVMCWLLDRV